MKAILSSLLVLGLLMVSCAPVTNPTPPTINGNWTLQTIQGAPVSSLPNTHGTMTVTGGSAFSRSTTVSGTSGTETGTVALKSGSVYTFTATGGSSTDYTLSSDGKSLSGTNGFLGPHTYGK